MKNAVFWDVVPLLIANVIRSSLILFTLMIETMRSSNTTVLTRATRRNVAEDSIILILLR
jgi:hypothetical protein